MKLAINVIGYFRKQIKQLWCPEPMGLQR